jgi:hypothetical protein
VGKIFYLFPALKHLTVDNGDAYYPQYGAHRKVLIADSNNMAMIEYYKTAGTLISPVRCLLALKHLHLTCTEFDKLEKLVCFMPQLTVLETLDLTIDFEQDSNNDSRCKYYGDSDSDEEEEMPTDEDKMTEERCLERLIEALPVTLVKLTITAPEHYLSVSDIGYLHEDNLDIIKSLKALPPTVWSIEYFGHVIRRLSDPIEA